MISEGIRVLLYGMAGIFMVMGVIIAVVSLLKYIGRDKSKGKKDAAR